MYEDILTKEFLVEQLLTLNKPLSVLSNELNISKITIIRRCKKLEIYDKVKFKRSKRKTKDILNQKFGSLLVIDYAENDCHGKSRWLCKCDCGKEKMINTASLIRGLSTTCGYCKISNFTGYKTVSGGWIRRIKENAEKRNLEFSITAKDIYDLFIKQNGKCCLSGVELKMHQCYEKSGECHTVSVDRINNLKGYIITNIQLIHKRLNRIKSVLSNEELIHWSHLIANNNKIYSNIENIENVKWNSGERKSQENS